MKHLLKALFALSFALSLLTGCSTPPGERGDDATASVDSYSTRGIVRALPSPDRPGSELQIRHEAMPEFRSIDGEVVGMKSMTMPFPTDASMLAGVAVGDKVSFDFEVRWTGSPPMRVTRLEVLPADTILDFETPAAAEPGSEPLAEPPA